MWRSLRLSAIETVFNKLDSILAVNEAQQLLHTVDSCTVSGHSAILKGFVGLYCDGNVFVLLLPGRSRSR